MDTSTVIFLIIIIILVVVIVWIYVKNNKSTAKNGTPVTPSGGAPTRLTQK